MRPTAIQFTSESLTLEGVLTTPEGFTGPHAALLACHPHPMLGGDMGNAVITAICREADTQGLVTMRFNFRGAGDSQGQFDNGEGEKQDVKAALDVLRRWPGVDGRRIGLAGYSFGASVILGGLRSYRTARSLAFVAPTVSSVQASRIMADKRPKLFVVGQHDRIVSSVDLQRALDGMTPPVQFAEIPEADHGLASGQDEVAQRVATFAAETLAS